MLSGACRVWQTFEEAAKLDAPALTILRGAAGTLRFSDGGIASA
jgi:hypothetical protein